MVKSAVVGVGYLGRFHAEKYAASTNTELVAVVDANFERAQAVASAVGAIPLSDFRQLPSLGVQCASVASDTVTHFEISSWLLSNGIDVLVEKPVTTTEAEARSLIQIARENDRVLQVGHLERFNPAVRAMKRVLSQPMFFEVRRIAPFKSRGHDVDVVLDLMIHDIDIVSHLVSRPLERVEAVGVPVLTNTVDIANARLRFEGGAIANFTASRAAFKTERTIRIFQPNVYIALDYAAKNLRIYTKTGDVDAVTGLPQIAIEEHQVGEQDALEQEVEAFLGCVVSRAVPEVSGFDGLRALELAARIQQAFLLSSADLAQTIGVSMTATDKVANVVSDNITTSAYR